MRSSRPMSPTFQQPGEGGDEGCAFGSGHDAFEGGEPAHAGDEFVVVHGDGGATGFAQDAQDEAVGEGQGHEEAVGGGVGVVGALGVVGSGFEGVNNGRRSPRLGRR